MRMQKSYLYSEFIISVNVLMQLQLIEQLIYLNYNITRPRIIKINARSCFNNI